ncbi:TspO/MBR family protein [Rhizobium halophytocola]|uniref:Tryptophan-rich sensory protein n=1 Tax=Rhizobium halophytocola TaxID=735519 RepID=A0ABS4E0I4_9HYPH|nr:TspO/MBR family protein [Rhizobium halophytocola]MBP1851419.1 tryptophan-rich sensory protein [Rhizobium halophytocola]
MKKFLVPAAFVVVVVALGIASGLSNAPGGWYEGLAKPAFNPPAFLFPPVWTLLYVLIGLAGARIWLRAPKSAAMQFWFGQLLLNLLWTPAFFGLHSLVLGLVVIVCLLLSIFAFIGLARPIDRVASLLFLPYAAWVAFATLLNLSILILN